MMINWGFSCPLFSFLLISDHALIECNKEGCQLSPKQNHTTNDFFKNRKKSINARQHVIDEVIQEAEMEFKVTMHSEKHHRIANKMSENPRKRHLLLQPDFFQHLIFGEYFEMFLS